MVIKIDRMNKLKMKCGKYNKWSKNNWISLNSGNGYTTTTMVLIIVVVIIVRWIGIIVI